MNRGASDRDRLTDAARDGDGQIRKEDVGYELSFAPLTVWEEKQNGGFQMGDTPTGARKVAPGMTAETRGASDVR